MKWWVALIIGLVLGIVATLLAMAGGWFDPRQGYDRQKPADGGQTGPVSHPPKDEWGSFPLRPKTELQDDGRTLRLLEDFVYLDPKKKGWTAQKDAIVDGASIPKIFWSVTGGPLDGQYRNASIVHDVACDRMTESWEDVHLMFYEACRCGGIAEIQAKILYAAVYHFGPRWELKKVIEAKIITNAHGQQRHVMAEKHFGQRVAVLPPTDRTRQEIEKYVNEKNPSLEDLRKLHPSAP